MDKSKPPHLLWNPDNVRDVAEALGIANLPEDSVRCLAQDAEYRIGQVLVEAMRFMRASRRTTLTVDDLAQALKVLDAEPLYGYDSNRPLRYGEASLGPGQPLYYIEDEEVDFEKLINAPLPKIPRDATFTAHWLAIEGVQPSIPQNPTAAESRTQELLPKGPGANPALAALAGNDNVSFKPTVKHIISKELILYFDKITHAILDETPEDEVVRLRESALESVRSDRGIQQLLPYFVNYISNSITHNLDDTFCLRQMMDLASALIANETLFIDSYATALSQSVLTCLLGRRLGPETGQDAVREQYQLRELAASLLGQIAKKYSKSNQLLRPKLTRTCLKHFLDPDRPPASHYGAICGISSAGGHETVRFIALPVLRDYDTKILQPLLDKDSADAKIVLGGIIKAIKTMSDGSLPMVNGINGASSDGDREQLVAFLGPNIGSAVARLGDHQLNRKILEVRHLD